MTPLPNIPTDNLYKFVFIAGLTLLLSGLVLYTTQYNIIIKQIDQVNLEVVKSTKETEFLKKDILELESEVQKVKLKLDKIKKIDSIDINQQIDDMKKNILRDKNYREYLAFIYEYKTEVIPYYEESHSTEAKYEAIKNKQRQIDTASAVVSLKLRLLKRDNNRLLFIGFISGLLIISGCFIAKNGYKRWYLYLQKPTDEKIKIELQQLKIEKP